MANFQEWFTKKLFENHCSITFEKDNGDVQAIEIDPTNEHTQTHLAVIDKFNGKTVNVKWDNLISYNFGDAREY